MEPLELAAALYLIVMNLAAFFLFAVDKGKAIKGRRRIPERRLHFSALLGGFLGGILGMQVFRHKTKKLSFIAVFSLASLLSGVALFYGWLYLF